MPGPKLTETWSIRVYIKNVMLLLDDALVLAMTPIIRFSETGRCQNHPTTIWD